MFHPAGRILTGTREFYLWLAFRPTERDPWQDPVNLGSVINSPKRDASACLSADGTELLFDSVRQGSLGAGDLYVSRRIRKVNDQTKDNNASSPKRAIAPFDFSQAQEYQQAWAQYLGVPVNHTNTIGMTFVLIPPGESSMGSTPAEIESAPKNPIEDDFWQLCAE